MTVEIVILAMIAAFLGLRLYSVLGRRAEREEEPIQGRLEGQQGAPRVPGAPSPAASRDAGDRPTVHHPGLRQPTLPASSPAVERGLREIAAADRRFDAFAFLDGAKAAYGMILEAFWKGDKDELGQLCDREVYDSFAAAIDARQAAGETLDNRLVRIEDATIVDARLDAQTARVTVRFRADIAAITRDAQGNVIAGSLDDAVEAIDVWTFARNVRSTDLDWLLEATDEG